MCFSFSFWQVFLYGVFKWRIEIYGLSSITGEWIPNTRTAWWYSKMGNSCISFWKNKVIFALSSFIFVFDALKLIAYEVTFLGQLYFWRSYFLTFFQSNYLDATVTFSEQLFLQRSYFFWGSPFQKSRFFAAVIFFRIATFSEPNFYQAASSWE